MIFIRSILASTPFSRHESCAKLPRHDSRTTRCRVEFGDSAGLAAGLEVLLAIARQLRWGTESKRARLRLMFAR